MWTSRSSKWILSYLKWAAGLGILFGYPLIDFCLGWRLVNKKGRVIKKLVERSRPALRQPGHIIGRPDVINDITSRFFQKLEITTRFGIIIGPSGSGKTYDLCTKHPKVVIYYEVREPSAFISGLIKEICMKTLPFTIFDLLIGYVSKRYIITSSHLLN